MSNNDEFEFDFPEVPVYLTESLKGIKVIMDGITSSLGPFLKEIQNTMKQLEIVAEGLKETNKSYAIFMDKSAKLGWVPLLNWELNYEFYSKGNELTLEELNDLYLNSLEKDDYSSTFQLLDDLEDNLDSGYKLEVNKIKKILEVDIDNYTLVIPHLYILLDYIFANIYNDGDLSKQEYMNNKNVKKMIKDKKIEDESYSGYYQLMQYNCLKLLNAHVKFSPFANPVFNRHHVLHGRFDPVNYDFSNFLKLLVLCSNLSWYFQLENNQEE